MKSLKLQKVIPGLKVDNLSYSWIKKSHERNIKSVHFRKRLNLTFVFVWRHNSSLRKIIWIRRENLNIYIFVKRCKYSLIIRLNDLITIHIPNFFLCYPKMTKGWRIFLDSVNQEWPWFERILSYLGVDRCNEYSVSGVTWVKNALGVSHKWPWTQKNSVKLRVTCVENSQGNNEWS